MNTFSLRKRTQFGTWNINTINQPSTVDTRLLTFIQVYVSKEQASPYEKNVFFCKLIRLAGM